MPKIIIDDLTLEVSEGQTILQAAALAGIIIPHYCYHPGLHLAGCCRMCQVEVKGIAKLQTACNTSIKEGMVVCTHSQQVRLAQQAVMEFLLLNHPLDCPVCDQAGECGLQSYYMLYGRTGSRLADNKLTRQKAKPIGPHIILDQDRCILCLRCVRFCRDITKTAELGVFYRGDQSVIDIYPGYELHNKYSGNLADICPVGALTDRDFRFQVRVWYLRHGNSICSGCSRGCSMVAYYNQERRHHAQGRRIVRLKPRYCAEVNSWWMCDEGRYAYRAWDDQRLSWPLRRRNGSSERVSWDLILAEIAGRLKSLIDMYGNSSIAVWGSPQLPNEDLYLIHHFFGQSLGIPYLAFDNPGEKPGYGDDFLIQSDKNPNRRGALWLGWKEGFDGGLDPKALLQSGKLKALLVFRHDLTLLIPQEELPEQMKNLNLLIYFGTNECATSKLAHYLLPAVPHVERDGSFTNCAGRIQHFLQVIDPLEEALPDWKIVQRLALHLGITYPYQRCKDVFRDLSIAFPPFAGFGYETMETPGEAQGVGYEWSPE